MSKFIAVGISFVLAMLVSHIAGDLTRMATWRRAHNIKSEAALPQATLHHSLIRMRDDISWMQSTLTLSNALLAAILAAILF